MYCFAYGKSRGCSFPPPQKKMRRPGTLVILLATLFSAATLKAQTITLALHEAPIETAFQQIEKQSSYQFVYATETLKNAKPVTLKVGAASLPAVLSMLFAIEPLRYEIRDHYILVKARTDPPSPPAIDLHGLITNENGGPISGVSITVKGTTRTTETDQDGGFHLDGVEEGAVLIISHVGYYPQELPLEGRNFLQIQLKTKVTQLDAVNINFETGYQHIPKERATGSFATPEPEVFENRVATDVLSKLEGITSGLVSTQDPFSGERKLMIRGRSTIFAGDQPLIVLDNFPYEGDISSINPKDIENVTVLKDAAAASIWGIRAGNGVIVITTKKGRYNQPFSLQLNSSLTVGERPNLFYNPNFLPSAQFIHMETTLFKQGYYNSDLSSSEYPPISPVVELLYAEQQGRLSSSALEDQLQKLSSVDVRKEEEKYLYRPSLAQQYHLNFSGGTPNTNYQFSAGWDKDLLSQMGSSIQRLTLNGSYALKPFKNLELSAGISYEQNGSLADNLFMQLRTGGPDGKALSPYTQLKDNQGNDLPILKDYRSSFVAVAPGSGFLNWSFTPLQELGLWTQRGTSFQDRISLAASYQFMQGLSVEMSYNNQKILTQGKNLADPSSYYARNLENSYAQLSSQGVVSGWNIPIGGIVDFSNSIYQSYSLRGQLNYERSWGAHSLHAIAGAEAREISTSANTNRLYGYSDELGTYQFVDLNTFFSSLNPYGFGRIPSGVAVSGTLNRFRSFYSNAGYTFQGKYTLTASARIDQSNFFGVRSNQRSVPLWSSGLKWDLSKERLYHAPWLPQLSLRATYGFNGNLDKTTTAFTTARYSTGAPYTSLNYAFISNPPDPDLRWEKTRMMNLGIDFALKNKTLSGSVEYFIKKGNDLMGDALLAPSIGFQNPITGTASVRGNFAALSGKGWDLQMESKNLNGKLRWTTHYLLSHATDRVTRYDVPNTPFAYVNYGSGNQGTSFPMVGKPVYGIYSYRWGGLDTETGDPMGYISKDSSSKDYAALVNPKDVTAIIYNGPAQPTYFGGVSNTFSWKGFSLSFTLSFKMGYYFRRSSINYSALFVNWSGNQDYLRRWQAPGDEKTTFVPSMPTAVDYSRDKFYNYASVLVDKADHIRWQDLSLSYELRKEDRPRLPFKALRLYIYCNNIGILWRANPDHLDPDLQGNALPAPLTVSMGLKAAF